MITSDQIERLNRLSPAKRAVLLEAMRRKATEGEKEKAIPRRPAGEPIPLSYAQQRLWFLFQLQPDSPVYNISSALRFDGPLDPACLRRALTEVVRRHEVLRTAFPAVDGLPVQRIAPASEVPVPVVDLSALPAALRELHMRRLATRETARPFDLETGPLLRVLLCRFSAESHEVLLTVHHIVSDDWSKAVFTRELTTLYGAFLHGELSPLPELELQYSDFSFWQRCRLEGEMLEGLLGYWKRQLAGLKVLELPTDHPRPALQTFHGARRIFAVPERLTERLRELSRQEGATLFMTVLAVYQTLLHRLSGQDDVVTGSPVANRNRAETEPLIGCFVNTLVLRTDFSGSPSLRELLARVRRMVIEASDHQDVPFEKLVEELQPERDPSRNPLFQVVLAFQNTPREAMRLPSLALRSMDVESRTAKFDLRISLIETGGGMTGALEHNTDLFERTTAERFLGYWLRLLEAAVELPDAPVWRLEMLPAWERQQVIAEWNDTVERVDGPQTIHARVEAQVRRAPAALAVVSDEESLSYAEVNRRANRLAHRLRSLGAGVGSLVGVYLGRSAAVVPALLGILKSGGAYVPVDPSYPAARVEWILSTLGIRWVVSEEALAGGLPAVASLEHVVLAGDETWGAGPGEDPEAGVGGGDLAYIIFTSGSTGRPKGVVVRHRPAVNLIDWVESRFGVGPGDRVLFITSLCFDLSVYDVFGLLAAGGTVRVAPEEAVREPDRLVELLDTEPITFWDSAPAALQQLVPFFSRPAGTPSLRLVFLSGDWIPVTLPDEVRGRYPGARMISLGGATEATVWSNVFPIGEVPRHWRSIPYGRPIRNARYLILDAGLEPCPIGVPGDLYIGGGCLASGYAAAPELTADRFLPDPFAARPGTRLYRTGDRARFWADGTMEFLGRLDQQVKVRGFRVELGEIEAVLAEHPEVSEAVAVAREDGGSRHKRLVAYVVARGGTAPDGAELRRFLAERLPAYMVPSAFVELAALPVTANGKLDRKALPAPEGARPEREGSRTAPRNPVEEQLAGIWSDVLRLDRVGIHDNFFEIGGDSILSIQIVSRARQVGLLLTPRQVFEHQTIAELAAVAGSCQGTEAEQGLVTGPVPLTPIQRWFLDPDPVDPHHFNQALLLSVRRPLDPAALQWATGRLLEAHDTLRLRLARTAEGWRQEISAEAGPEPFVHVDLAALPESEQGTQVTAVATALQASLDLARGPVLRVAWMNLGDGRPGRLFLVIHHLAVDGVSWRILLDDLQRLCDERGRGAGLPPKTTSFKRWAERLAGYAASPEVAREAEHWLAGARRHGVRLPVDHPGGLETVASVRGVRVALDPEETRALLQEVPAVYHTEINDVLLAALTGALAPWTGSRRLLVDLEGHGRTDLFEEVDLSRTVGWFTSIVPVLLDLEGETRPGEALKRIKEQLRQVPRGGLGYGLPRELPEAEVSFNYLGQLDQALAEDSPFAPAPEPAGPAQSPRQRPPYRLQVSARVGGGRLWATVGASRNLYETSTIEALAERFLAELRTLIRHCQSTEAGGYTPSDFPDAELDQGELDGLLEEMDLS